MAGRTAESKPSEYEFEITASREEIAEVLNGVIDGVLTGAIQLGEGADAVSVGIPEDLSLEIEFEIEEDELSLELELEWPPDNVDHIDLSTENRSVEASEEPTLLNAADGSESLARFEIYRDRGEEWRWRLRHRNGNIIAISGEGYTLKHNAHKGLRSVIENSSEAEITEAVTD